MVNQQALERLTDMADLYQRFLELDKTERIWLKQLMGKRVASTIELLELIEEIELTYEEIGNSVGIHSTTVRQKLHALSKGGFPVNLKSATAILELGRPRVVVKKTKE